MSRDIDKIKKDIDDIADKRDELLLEVKDYQEQLEKLSEEYYKANPDYIEISCPTCGGVGHYKGEDGKLHPCKNEQLPMFSCNGKGYIWMKVWSSR